MDSIQFIVFAVCEIFLWDIYANTQLLFDLILIGTKHLVLTLTVIFVPLSLLSYVCTYDQYLINIHVSFGYFSVYQQAKTMRVHSFLVLYLKCSLNKY